MFRRTQSDWPPAKDLTTERMAFLAAQPQLEKRSAKGLPRLLRFLDAAGGMSGMRMRYGSAPSMSYVGPADDWRNHRMQDLVVACDELARHMHPEDRAILRISGHLPKDFLDRVDAEASRLHREERHKP
jgi:hypothetical protein